VRRKRKEKAKEKVFGKIEIGRWIHQHPLWHNHFERA